MYIGQMEMHLKNNDICIFPRRAAHAVFLVSVYSPVNCIACSGVDVSIPLVLLLQHGVICVLVVYKPV